MPGSDQRSTATVRQVQLGRALARWIRFVRRTSTLATEPSDHAAHMWAHHPAIIAMWHGQFMLVPALSPPRLSVRIGAARHGDAEIIAEALRTFEMGLIRGSGAGSRKGDRGGAHLLKAAISALKSGHSVPITADVPPGPARRAGLGIVTLARMSGRPILPAAVASSRFLALDTWSRMTVNLPYSRLGACVGAPIYVPRDATPAVLEACRLQVEEALDDATRRAYELARGNILAATPPAARWRMGGSLEPPLGTRLRLYRGATTALQPLVPMILRHREKRGKEEPARRPERFGIASEPRPSGMLVWLHAASVGETNAVLPIIQALASSRPDTSVLLTTGTVTSARLAASRLPTTARHQYVPLDSSAYMRRFLDHWQPQLAVLTESEIWPNLVLETAARLIPIALVNGRMSKRSYRGWKRRRLTAAALFGRLTLVLAQNAQFADWFRDLGARLVINTGNLKMDAPGQPVDGGALEALRHATQDRRVILAASTHANEEEQLAKVHRALKANFPDLLTIIAPRHPERGAALAAEIGDFGLSVRRRAAGEMPEPSTDIYLADTIGELGTLYALTSVCFMGGSLVPHGGQNPIEAVKGGSAVIMGPHTVNFADTYEALLDADGARRVATADELTEALSGVLSDREAVALMHQRAKRVVDDMSGALSRTMAALLDLLSAESSTTRAGTASVSPCCTNLPPPAASGFQHAD